VNKLRTTLLSAAALLVFGAVIPASTAHAADTDLKTALDQIVAGSALSGSLVAVQVREANTGAVLYARNSDQRVIPASNNKLLTSTSALEVLGADYRFHTKVLTGGKRVGGVLAGPLYLKGGGDPTMLAADYDALAKQVADSGVKVVAGELVADDTWFDDVRLGRDWAWDDEPAYYTAPNSALTVASNPDFDPATVIVTATGTTAGQPATLAMTPANGTEHLVNRTTTGAAGSASTIAVTREHGTDNLVLTGSVAAGAVSAGLEVSVFNPTAYAASVFRNALTAHGVRVAGPTTFKAAPAGAAELADHPSMTLAQLLVPFLKLSNNMHAEVLVKAMGRQKSNAGTYTAGLAAEQSALRGLGVDTSVLRTVDGSGLSRQDHVTNQQITNLLLAARGKPWFGTWYNALPVAGVPDRMVGGTLRSRMGGTPAANNLHGKTGTLTGVSALSGYVTDASGRPLVFSAIVNMNLGGVTPSLDQIGVTLASTTATGVAEGALTKRAPAAKPQPDDVECSWVNAC
jgi:D-alanyl-D-alanine carboxypeptidase/D-alanyl-D-alanine-endopeptidase (penicillin-binding protein 4)